MSSENTTSSRCGHRMPILHYGSNPPVSNRVQALTSFVLPVHSLGVSAAQLRGQSPKANDMLTSDLSAEIPIAPAQHSPERTFSVHCNHFVAVTALSGNTVPFQSPPKRAVAGLRDCLPVDIFRYKLRIVFCSVLQHAVEYPDDFPRNCHQRLHFFKRFFFSRRVIPVVFLHFFIAYYHASRHMEEYPP